MTANADALHAKWVEWLEDIHSEVIRLHTHRAVWREIVDMLEGNEEIPERFFFRNWLTEHYVARQALGVRRQAEVREDVVSMARLLAEMVQHPDVLTRERFRVLCNPNRDSDLADAIDAWFDRWARREEAHIRAAEFERRLERLRELASGIRNYANRRIAHFADRPPAQTPTFGELDQAIEFLGELLEEMTLLLRCASLASRTAEIMAPWQNAFTIPWKPAEVDPL